MVTSERHDASAHTRGGNGMPLAGIGLPLAEANRNGISDELYVDALRRAFVPPVLDVGLGWRAPAGGGNPGILGSLFADWRALAGDLAPTAPPPDHPAFRNLRSETQLLRLLPLVGLPGTAEYWVFWEHLSGLLWRLTAGDIDVSVEPPRNDLPQPDPGPVPFSVPGATGPVRVEHFDRFFAGYPAVGRNIARGLMLFTPRNDVIASIANEAAYVRLGIHVDVRLGSLVSSDDISVAVDHAAGDGPDARVGTARGRIEEFVEDLVPRVDQRAARRVDDLAGAAWSCAVDQVLNGPLIWRRGRDGAPLWAGEVPDMAEHRRRWQEGVFR
jgi:hypothetical protein